MKRTILLLLFVSMLYAPYLGNLITYDEVVTVRYFAVSPVYALVLWAAPNNHMLHSLLVWASTSILGRSELAIRLPAYFAAMLAIASICRLGRRIDSAQSGFVGAIILACISSFITFATTARGYSLGLFLSVQLIEQVLFPGGSSSRLIFLLSVALVLVLPSMIMLVTGIGLWAVWQSRRVVPALAVGAICGSMFYLPSLIWRTAVIDFGLPTLSDLAINFGLLLKPLPLWGLLILLATVGFFRFRPRQRLLWGSIALATVSITLVQWGVLHRFFYARNYLYSFPLLAIPAAMAVVRLPRWYQGLVVLGWILPSMMWATTQTPISADILSVEPDLPRLLRYIKTELTPNDGLMVGCCIDQPLWYYAAAEVEQLEPQGKQHLVAVATSHATLEQVLEAYGIEATCILSQHWQAVTLYECTSQENRQ